MSNHTIALFVSFRPLPGQEQGLRDELLALAEVSLQEPGCERYDVHADLDDPGRIWLYERWASKKALALHDQAEHVAAFMAALPSLAEAGFERAVTYPLRRP